MLHQTEQRNRSRAISIERKVTETGIERRAKRRGERDRYLPKTQGGVPGGRFFLTSMFCFIKAAN